MGGEDDVVEGGQGGREGVAVGAWLLREHVNGCTTEVAGDECGVQGVHVDDVSAREVDEQGTGFHELEFGATDQVGVGLLAVHVYGDDVGFAQHGLHGGHLCGVAQGEALGGVVEDDVEAHGLARTESCVPSVAVAE